MNIKIKYYYKVYGLKIESEVKIEEFVEISKIEMGSEYIKITIGSIDDIIKKEIAAGKRAGFEKDQTWFHVSDVATYLIQKGDQIVVEACSQCDKELMKVFLMCSCLGFIMIQRNKVAIHGGTVVMGDKAIIITGDRGAGKSTLTTALRLKKYKFLADDVAATTLEEVPMIEPGFPYQKLCGDVMEKLGYDKDQCNSFMSDTQIKYIVPAKEDFLETSVPLGAICEVVPSEVEAVEIDQVKGQEKLMYIMKNLYRGEFLNALGGVQGVYFKQCVEIAKHIEFYRVKRPRVGFTVEEQIEKIRKLVL